MRHRVAHRKLGRVTEHRIAMLRNQALDLLRHERIQTTVPKAKELRPFVERLISIAKRSGSDAGNGRALFARRLVSRDLHDPDVVKKLFDTLAPRYVDRPGGYTRLLKLGHRRGDNAEVAQVELVGSEYNPKAAGDKDGKSKTPGAKPKGMGGRLKAAAERLRGRKASAAEATEETHEKADKRTSGKSRARASSQKKPG
ncbi:MAG: 50S ribosomal protein L17 [Acidobacteria bacterium]|nr:MAG: 50S ribosomal protein L17 [Acidobacteriota bacterium]